MVAALLLRASHPAARPIALQQGQALTSRLGNPVMQCTRKSSFPRLQRFSSSAFRGQEDTLDRTRNIGIIAHIDAGKTTTTERMLYYSGFTRRIGDVDEGSTVTDFLPAERARGITIQSAAITFHWPPQTAAGEANQSDLQAPRSAHSHIVNLIDTPGHADFTFEVLRSLRILDGAVCILDGVAGVEAQTEKVWHQASTYRIPRIVYINKLDRDGAAFGRTVREVASRLAGWPAVCQIPWFEGGDGRFVGVADVINLQGLRWEDGDGKSVKMLNLQQLEAEEGRLAQELKRARTALVELLSEYDELMVEQFFEHDEDHLAVPANEILQSLRRCLLQEQGRKIIPVFAGASFRNVGVQPLLDAVVNLLPSPVETPDPEKKSVVQTESQNAIEKLQGCALAFKVVNDAKRGVLVYVRVYAGRLDRSCALYNTNLKVTERAPRLLKMYANDAVEVDSIPEGHIGVVVGLKHARTGDTLVTYATNRQTPPEPLDTLQLRPIKVPPPVFFASVEPHSLSEEKRIHEALAMLLREDPSLHVTVDEDSGQTLLSGMGELHLEIARDRLINELKAKATVGRIEIGYRECPTGDSEPVTKIFDKEVAGRKGKAGCTASVSAFDPDLDGLPTTDADTLLLETQDGNQIIIQAPGLQITRNRKGIEESAILPVGLDVATLRTSLLNGCIAALARGPQFSFPMHNTRVHLTLDAASHLFGTESTPSAVASAARLATTTALRSLLTNPGTGTSLMEPVMNVIISIDEASLGAVVHDISSARGGHIISLDEDIPLPSTDAASSTLSTTTSATNIIPYEDLPPIDPSKVYAPPDPFETPTIAHLGTSSSSSSAAAALPDTAHRPRTITAKVPLKEMVGYLKHLRSLSAGRGTFVMSVDRFEKMSGPRQKAVVSELRGGY
ncbi:hypothetical protein ASPACDRAFT_1874144 [Aspergillus aculeatus ATCC 16872]|uniref:Ribosome-releasing factor 2, mitochondrial n=1 Tax=Aspergillus aculeatus (strain ATCC 16872 / CBS 172.66 / WB 5094) TaxID=690307 RepID=A0A1L9WL04_ASPA1|nr:uncharacterized protein ASPACDRAFT_1874144 [Aspergillus aculeatus ATCC 16872]OJJ96843.1 hypothetical protein ASPACDRAFT_1874144 [Aspergillus aculeatus ATCC 16872]